jgi:hypothetical protein
MLARFVLGAVTAGAVIAPALAGQMMSAEEARKFVAGKVFAFTCFDGTRGAGRVFEDGGAAGAVQFSGTGPLRHLRLPGNTLQVRGESVCASIKGIPFEPCFNLDKKDEGTDDDGAGGGPAAFAASAGADRLGGSVRARRDASRREREDRAGQTRTGEIGKRAGAAPLDRLTG